jgi:hypothetical protein
MTNSLKKILGNKKLHTIPDIKVDNSPLYNDDKIKIEAAASIEDHDMYIGKEYFLIQRGILRDWALTKRGELESKLYNRNTNYIMSLKKEEITVDGLHLALCQAYHEEEKRRDEYVRRLREDRRSERIKIGI